MADKTILDFNELTDTEDDDVLYVVRGTDVTRENHTTKANFLRGINASAKGSNNVVLTNYLTTTVPAIAAGSSCEVNGSLLSNPSEVAITGSTSNSTWYDILLTPSGTSFTASFVARGTGVWSDSKQGLYDGNNRVVGCVYRDGGGNFINKNILVVQNRNCIVKIEIGNWDMNTSATVNVDIPDSGFVLDSARNVSVIIREDISSDKHAFFNHINSETDEFQSIQMLVSLERIALRRPTGGFFDNGDFQSNSINRGWVTITYEV